MYAKDWSSCPTEKKIFGFFFSLKVDPTEVSGAAYRVPLSVPRLQISAGVQSLTEPQNNDTWASTVWK